MSTWEGVAKVELHVHLFGAIPPRVLLELARRHRVALPADTVEGLRKWPRFSDFAGFEEAFVTIASCVQTADDMELIGRKFVRELSGQRVRYAEVMISPAAVADAGIEISRQLEVLESVRMWASDELEVDLRWIFDINRRLPDTRRRLRAADLTLEAALAGRERGVVALGLSAAEAGYPPEQFAPWFERARSAGLHSVPHAGGAYP